MSNKYSNFLFLKTDIKDVLFDIDQVIETIGCLYFFKIFSIVRLMDLNFIILDGYGLFVWPAFIFTFVSCFYLYKKTKTDLLKQEKMFLIEFDESQINKIEFLKGKKATQEALSIN